MRIVLTSESYLPYLSGVTVSVDAQARGLGARGHEVMVLAPRPARDARIEPVGSPGPSPRHVWLPSYQLGAIVPPSYRMPWPNPWSGALREAREFGPDIVHAHSPFVTGLLARTLARSTAAPLVFTHHTRFADYAHYIGLLASPGRRLTAAYLRGFWRACAAIVAPSQDLAGSIRDEIGSDPAGRVRVIPTGIDVAGIQALPSVDSRPEVGWPADALVAASLGRLAPEKSPELLLDAFALASGRLPQLRLLVVGGGSSESALRRRIATDDLRDRVHFTGALARPDALSRIAGADLFVFTSRTETQGLVLAEALSAGLPAIALDGPGVRDSIRDGIDGIVVRAGPGVSPLDSLADAMVDISTDAARRSAMAERARVDATRFAIERRIADLEALYRTLAGPAS
jgi:glycosyltransferase involved in cell wall biosynthesis